MKTIIQKLAPLKSNAILALLFMIALHSSTVMAFEKTGTTSFQFLSVRPSSRAASMAGAFCTLANNSEASFWNPAGLVKITGSDVSLSYINYFFDIKMYSFSAAVSTSDWGTVGVFGLYSNIGSIEETRTDYLTFDGKNFNPGLTGATFSPYQFYAGISYAKALTENFAFGLNVKYVKENLIYAKASAIIFDGGINFNTGYKSIQIGASVKNFGPDVKFIDKSYPVPQTLNIGASANLIGAQDENLFMTSRVHQLLLSYDMIQPRDFDQEHAVGLEYTYGKMVSLRGGYKFNGDQEGLSAGFGLQYEGVRFDYAYSSFGDYLPAVHRLSIGFELR